MRTKQKAPADRSVHEIRKLNEVTLKMGSSVATSTPNTSVPTDHDTIELTRIKGDYVGYWDIGEFIHGGSVVQATVVKGGRHLPVGSLSWRRWDSIKLKAQGRITVRGLDYSAWESKELEAVEADPKAQAIVNGLLDV